MLMGTIYAVGAYLQSILSPLCANSLGSPVLLLVPSGKIIAERLFFSMYSANAFICGMACLGLLRSICTHLLLRI